MKIERKIKDAISLGLLLFILCLLSPHSIATAQVAQDNPFGITMEPTSTDEISAQLERELRSGQYKERDTVFSLKPDLRYSFGETSYYLLNYSEVANQPGELTKYESELTFPLDVTQAGLSMEWTSSSHANTWWAFEASFLTNVVDPKSKMRDNDWINETQIYHTESDAELKMTTLDTKLKYEFFRGVRTSMMFTGSLFYQRIQQDISGYEGWYTSPQSPISGNEPVLHYEVDYFSPQIGVAGLIRLGYDLAIELEVSSGPVFASDEDLHLQRGKRSSADANGYALGSGIKFRLLPDPVVGLHFSFDLMGGFDYFHAEGNQTQEWYLSEPGVPAGTVYNNIPHEFDSFQLNLGLRVGCTF